MYILKTALLVGMFLLVSANDQTKPRGKRQQITYYPRRGGRPPPYAVQMEPIVQYSQRDPLYNPSANPKSDSNSYHDDPTLFNHYSNEPEPIIEIIIKESNETLPTPRPPTVPQPRPTKEPIQVFYVKYEKKKGPGDSQPRVIYDPPVPALTPVEEHEEIKTGGVDDHNKDDSHLYATEAPAPEPSTTLRAIIRPESEVYHSGSSGIRVTFGTEQIPPNNHSKRSDAGAHSTNSTPPQTSSVTALPPPGSPKRQHGPYHNIQPSFPRVPPAFPQQRIVNSFSSQQQLPPNFPGPHQQFQSPPNGPTNPPRPQQQRPPITIQNLPEFQQRLPFQSFAAPHRVSINHPQQPGFPHALSVSHQNVHLQNQPPSLVSAGNFNGNIQQRPNQQKPFSQQHLPQQQLPPQQQHVQSYKDQELEKQRYHQEQRRQQELRYREQQRLQGQQRQQEQQKQQEHQRKLEEQRILDQQRQAEHQRQQERQRQEEQLRIQEQQKFHLEQQHRKQEQENRLLHEQQSRQQYKFGSSQPTLNPVFNQQLQQPVQQPRPGGEILKAVPKLEQHYAIRENPLHPGPFPPNPQVQPIHYPEPSPNQYSQPSASPSPDVQQHSQQQQQYFSRPTNNIASSSSQQQQQQQIRQLQQQHNSPANHENYQSNQQSFFAQNLATSQQQRVVPSAQKSIWGRPVFQENDKQKIYATPISNSNDLGISSTARTIYQSSTTPATIPTTTTAPTTTEAPTTAAPKNEEKIKANIANLPDEVPDDIREQLLSSGILGNADIQILDYDKVGGINIENLPPEALANFYGAGGAAAAAASEPVPAIAKRPKTVANSASSQYPKKATFTKVEHATLRPGGVEMKVVHFDPNTAQGQAIADQHIREDATHLKPVTVGGRTDPQYNRYLPLKVSGTSFPIPDAPELQGRKISSVVVLAPIDYNAFRDGEQNDHEESRQSRMLVGPQPVKFLAGDSLKQLVKKPSAENYKKWLEQESRTEPQRQSVVLLVTTPQDDSHGEKEIFMYDVSSQSVSKLSGDLSSAFVNAAESNSDSSDTIDDSAFTTY